MTQGVLSIANGFLLATYLTILAVISAYGLHRYLLVYLYFKHRDREPKLSSCFTSLPSVTIQIPMYNEKCVARRIIEKACQIRYPREKLEIQVLDDSTDETTALAAQIVRELQEKGHNIQLLHRNHRAGYKAGALQEGLRVARGEFVCIFDADFIPPPETLLDSIHYFTDPEVGMVQLRWDHVNRQQSWLTQSQAILLDGHFVMEHGARHRAGRFMNFNGTAGLWRNTCIEDAGGWQHDTLTEDLDLSYRAQLKGWKFLFVPSTVVPAELPPNISAFKSQQYRWTKGGAQTCKKLLGTILRSDFSWRIKLEAFYHLTSHVVYAFVFLLTLLLFPVIYFSPQLPGLEESDAGRLLFGFSLLVLATFSAGTFYACSQREIKMGWWQSIRHIPAIMSLGIGITINNTLAMLHGFFGKPSEFVRTPKYGIGSDSVALTQGRAYNVVRDFKLQPLCELGMGLYMAFCLWTALWTERAYLGIPFIFLFMVGYLYVGIASLHDAWSERQAGSLPAQTPRPAPHYS